MDKKEFVYDNEMEKPAGFWEELIQRKPSDEEVSQLVLEAEEHLRENPTAVFHCVFTLVLQTKCQFANPNSEIWKETFNRIEALCEKYHDDEKLIYIMRGAFSYKCHDTDFALERFDTLLNEPFYTYRMAEAIAGGLACLSDQVSPATDMEKITAYLEMLNKEYIENEYIASMYAQVLSKPIQ